MDQKKIRLMAMTGVMAAMIFIATAYLHVNTNAGYTHFGDGLIFLSASILPTPYAIAAAAIGAGLADVVSMPIWAPGTIIIKAVTVLFFTSKKDTILCKRNFLALIPSLAMCICGYSLYEAFVMIGFSFAAIAKAFASTPAYCVQIAGSSVLFIVLGKAFDKIKLKERFGFIKQTA